MSVTVELAAPVLARLRAEAARRGVSIEEVITELVGRLPAGTNSPRRRLSFAGTLDAEPNLSERTDEVLDEIVRRNVE